MSLYPIFLKIESSPCLVVGGGKVAERKVESLLQAGARVTVVAPEVGAAINALAEADQIEWRRQTYRSGEAGDYTLVIAATDSPGVNRSVYRDAMQNRVLVNSVDDPEHCSFYVPALVKRGQLLVAVSTSGAVPYFARKLRQYLETKLYPGIGRDLERLKKLRSAILRRTAGSRKEKKEQFEQLLKPEVEQILKKVDKE